MGCGATNQSGICADRVSPVNLGSYACVCGDASDAKVQKIGTVVNVVPTAKATVANEAVDMAAACVVSSYIPTAEPSREQDDPEEHVTDSPKDLPVAEKVATGSPPRAWLPDSCVRRQDTYIDDRPERILCELDHGDYEQAIDFISEVPLLQGLPKANVPLLVQSMRKVQYEFGEVVIHQGQLNNQLFIILHGEATVSRRASISSPASEHCPPAGFSPHGSANPSWPLGPGETRLMSLAAGDYFGEQELLHEETARATVRATGVDSPSLVIFSISHEAFWRLGLQEHLIIPRRRCVVDMREARRASKQREDAARRPLQKTQADRELIFSVIRANARLNAICPLTDDLIQQLADVAIRESVAEDTVVMQQGDLHSGRFYIVEEGSFEVSRFRCVSGRSSPCKGVGWEGQSPLRKATARSPSKGSPPLRIAASGSFGELELLCSAPCAATVRALEDSIVWVIDHSDFTSVLRNRFKARLEGYVEALRSVRLLSSLYHEELLALAEALTEASYKMGKQVISEGESGSTFFVLVEGEVVFERDGAEISRLTASRVTGIAHCFGEEELLRPGPRTATVRVTSPSATFLALDKACFDLILEPLDDLLRQIKEKGDTRSAAVASKDVQLAQEATWWSMACEYRDEPIEPKALQVRGCLGAGGAGSVCLAVDTRTGRQYALKRLVRERLQDTWSQRQVLNEKTILSMTCSPFVVNLHQTFRDEEALYFLLELAPGGDLLNFWVRSELHGHSASARFFAAGTVLALSHLHARRIIHRDVKPENILLDANGWPKLTDFGVAKFCIGRTFTICGTPNYMAPETLRQCGQTEAVDWWALGVFTYEMMAGRTPFERADEDLIKMFAAIQRGIPEPEAWNWPTAFDADIRSFAASLLHPRPTERLPMHANGLAELQDHAWFRGINWSTYEARAIDVPFRPPASVDAALRGDVEDADVGEETPPWSISGKVSCSPVNHFSAWSAPRDRNAMGWDAGF